MQFNKDIQDRNPEHRKIETQNIESYKIRFRILNLTETMMVENERPKTKDRIQLSKTVSLERNFFKFLRKLCFTIFFILSRRKIHHFFDFCEKGNLSKLGLDGLHEVLKMDLYKALKLIIRN